MAVEGTGDIDDIKNRFKKQRRQRTAPPPKHPRANTQPGGGPTPAATASAGDTQAGEQAAGEPPAGGQTASPVTTESVDTSQANPVSEQPAAEEAAAKDSAADADHGDQPAVDADSPDVSAGDSAAEGPSAEATGDAPAPDSEPAVEDKPQPQATEEVSRPAPAAESTASATGGGGVLPTPKHAWVMPETEIDPDDATALYVTPTVAKVPVAVMRRFNAARRGAASHTAIVLDAMFGHAQELDQLILAHRPEIAARYSRHRMPLRRLTAQKEKKDDLRIRPTEAELNYLKMLVDSINAWLEQNWPKTKPTDQSEVLTVLLDAHLPAARAKKDIAAS
ncbi:hypothetical protein [Nocardia wallacei]|uniref:hypothetical protein n=1 Tax=Nocardia wallacei TaxID=480035 RepID=UPI00245497FD|nr:hypothetical protein [Nocardia wallacei]